MNRTASKFDRMIEEAIKYGVYTPTNDNTVKDLIVLENILWRNFKISEH